MHYIFAYDLNICIFDYKKIYVRVSLTILYAQNITKLLMLLGKASLFLSFPCILN